MGMTATKAEPGLVAKAVPGAALPAITATSNSHGCTPAPGLRTGVGWLVGLVASSSLLLGLVGPQSSRQRLRHFGLPPPSGRALLLRSCVALT